jgi:hypothetical protein
VKSFFILLITACSVNAQDVRGLTWGMNPDEVAKNEGKRTYKAGINKDGYQFVTYQGNVASLKCVIAFYFLQSKLVGIKYIFNESQTDWNSYYDEFINVDFILEEKYGVADIEKIWTDEQYKDDPEKRGYAIAIGDFEMRSSRMNEKTLVKHKITGENFAVQHVIDFSTTSRELLALQPVKVTTKKATDEF